MPIRWMWSVRHETNSGSSAAIMAARMSGVGSTMCPRLLVHLSMSAASWSIYAARASWSAVSTTGRSMSLVVVASPRAKEPKRLACIGSGDQIDNALMMRSMIVVRSRVSATIASAATWSRLSR